MSRREKSTERKQISGCQRVEGEWGVTANGYGVSFWGDETAVILHHSDGYTIVNTLKSVICTHKMGEMHGMESQYKC